MSAADPAAAVDDQVSAFLGHANVAITASIYLHAVSMGDIEVLGDALSA